MISSDPAFVVVDNTKSELDALASAMNSLRLPVYSILYGSSPDAIDDHEFRGVRYLFFDLNLTDGTGVGSGDFNTIQSLLERGIDIQSGPYVLILWTKYPNQAQELSRHLVERIDRAEKLPLQVLALDKSDVLTAPERLKEKLEAAIAANDVITALFDWESAVKEGAGSALGDINRLIEPAENDYPQRAKAWKERVSLMSASSIGAANLNGREREAFNAAVIPLVADRVECRKMTSAQKASWKKMVTKSKAKNGQRSIQGDSAGAYHSFIHLHHSNDGIPPFVWGAITELPGKKSWKLLKGRLGGAKADILKSFGISKKDAGSVKPFVVRIGAGCDAAQDRREPKQFCLLLRLPIPLHTEEQDGSVIAHDITRAKLSPRWEKPGTWISPVFQRLDVDSKPYVFMAHGLYHFSLVEEQLAGLEANIRLRENLLGDLVSHIGRFQSRTGQILL